MNTLGGPLANSSTRSECKVPLFHVSAVSAVSAVPALLNMGHGLGLNKRLLSNFPVDQSSLVVPAPLVFGGSMGYTGGEYCWVVGLWSYDHEMAVCQNLVPLVNIKIAGKWMFIPLKLVLIGIDPYPNGESLC